MGVFLSAFLAAYTSHGEFFRIMWPTGRVFVSSLRFTQQKKYATHTQVGGGEFKQCLKKAKLGEVLQTLPRSWHCGLTCSSWKLPQSDDDCSLYSLMFP
ncbi:unnamed protein product [Cylicocyclus nassatus]|uniref:Uncharacterized protein n=1 Tax=Cylicocyclus nassatus TaxID=53992 RepID=A0AA36GTC7_CYLNA|nr:unnamed protein product [Cylicocyclus nassatus]